jgi:xanthine dehydrogenase YagS FAD-binding subunit
VLAEAAESVATPQIRNAATLAGNICQRPWCWYYRNGFKCLKNGGTTCYSISGENTFHAIFGGGPSYIVHPSDTAPALVALGATFRLVGPAGSARSPRPSSSRCRLPMRRERTCSATARCWHRSRLPAARRGVRSTYHKVLDREAWTTPSSAPRSSWR